MNNRLSDEKLCELCAYKKDCITPKETCLDFEALKRVRDAQLEALPKEMKLIDADDFLKINEPTLDEIKEYLKQSTAPETESSIMSAFTIIYAFKAVKLQLAADQLVQDKKRAELAKEIFTDIEKTARHVGLVSQDGSGGTLILDWDVYPNIKSKYLQEKGQSNARYDSIS
jgi:hypothetical protein